MCINYNVLNRSRYLRYNGETEYQIDEDKMNA